MADKDPSKKEKRPTALKRRLQDDKRNLLNKSFKSKVKTQLRRLETVAASANKETLTAEVNAAFSLLDKGVKKGILKANKANREKAKVSKLIK